MVTESKRIERPIIASRTVQDQLGLNGIVCYDRQMELGTVSRPMEHLIDDVDEERVCPVCGFVCGMSIHMGGTIFSIDEHEYMISLDYFSDCDHGYIEVTLHRRISDELFEVVENNYRAAIGICDKFTITYMSNYLGREVIFDVVFDDIEDEYIIE